MGLARQPRGARRKAMSVHIVDDEQRRDLPRWSSSTMYPDIACVAPPCICPRGAWNAAPPILGQAASAAMRQVSNRRILSEENTKAHEDPFRPGTDPHLSGTAPVSAPRIDRAPAAGTYSLPNKVCAGYLSSAKLTSSCSALYIGRGALRGGPHSFDPEGNPLSEWADISNWPDASHGLPWNEQSDLRRPLQ